MTDSSPTSRALQLLQRQGTARTRDLAKVGVTRTEIRRLIDRGLIERVARGLYALPGAGRTERQDLADVARLAPDGVICLLSALRFHDLTTQNPFEVWLAIRNKAWRPKIEHPPLRLVYFSGDSFVEGVEAHDVGGVDVRVYGAAKTVADCFKYRNKIGIDVAVEALRDFRRQHPKQLESVWRHAQVNRVARVIQPYLEGVE